MADEPNPAAGRNYHIGNVGVGARVAQGENISWIEGIGDLPGGKHRQPRLVPDLLIPPTPPAERHLLPNAGARHKHLYREGDDGAERADDRETEEAKKHRRQKFDEFLSNRELLHNP